ncbi:MAG: hypothetical protein KJ720_17465 [Proteobacteria bacterium]|nr:hypothetical protein [Pseudomonadota bacterium]MBU1451086.1 hypothetical protein [Pseudomonadota bacterium]MBU2467780.1 hypothetical protein [Pseudomonadota bacterium]MBU2517820.1 hypothetical protein [Pseudomonadota bacterium]
MELTAGKLRAAGWMVILAAVLGISGPALKYRVTGALRDIFVDKWYDVYLLILSALFICVLLIFRLLLNEFFAFKKLDLTINLLLVAFLLEPLIAIGLSIIKVAYLPIYFGWLLDFIRSVLYLYAIWILLKKPVDIFGYSRKLSISLFVTLACTGVVVVPDIFMWVLFVADKASLGDYLAPRVIPTQPFEITGIVIGIYFIVIAVRMFFTAARAVEAARPPEALTQG